MLDLANLARCYGTALTLRHRQLFEGWTGRIPAMLRCLFAMCHPDGEIGFFNDAAIGIAPPPAELEDYARRLRRTSVGPVRGKPNGRLDPSAFKATAYSHSHHIHLADSGYIRVVWGDMVALLDVAPVGPDYLPGHAHADTLSFEISLFGRRVLVNSGISRYGIGPERSWQRGTAAHNTVSINRRDSSEVWGGFRVARRAKPFGLHIEEAENSLKVVCAHDGYRHLPGKPVHKARVVFFGRHAGSRRYHRRRF